MTSCSGGSLGSVSTMRCGSFEVLDGPRHAERVAALHMIEPHADRPNRITLGGDKTLRQCRIGQRDSLDERDPARGAEH